MVHGRTLRLLEVALAAGLAACSSSPPTVPPSAASSSLSPSLRPTPTRQPAPPSLEAACISTDGVKARTMWFAASDGVRLYGIEAGTGATAVVLAHEGGANLCGWLQYIRTLERAGIRAFAFNFRGYPYSGDPSEGRLALGRDLAGAAARVRADGAKHVFLMGASLGGAAVVQNSAGIRVDGTHQPVRYPTPGGLRGERFSWRPEPECPISLRGDAERLAGSPR